MARHELKELKAAEMQNQPIFPCHVCGAQFHAEIILQRHNKIHENGDVPTNVSRICCFCNKIFENANLLSAHMSTHIKVNNF